MILEKQTEAIVHQEGQSQDSIGMSLDLDSAQILMQMLSKNLYSDSIGSTVRECASNALDSHRRAGVDKPIIVSLKVNAANNYEFSVEDFGIGLDAEDVKNIISKYGKSTKRNSATELGMMGLGFKAPLAYSSSFYFVCRKDGMERKYMMYEGEDTNTIDLLYEKPTKEGNGVKVIVPVAGHYDRREFETKIKEQLAYFENVYFDCPGIDNNFLIHRAEDFQFSELANDGKMHICLDNVYYPIDFVRLGIDNIHFPVGLRFGLSDGIFPTPNRESIRYTKEAKDLILKKIEKVANFYIERYNESIQDTDDLRAIIDHLSNNDRFVRGIGGKNFNISGIEQYATIPMAVPKLKDCHLLDVETLNRNKEYLLGEYELKYRVTRGKLREAKQYWDKTVKMFHKYSNDANAIYYVYSDRIPGKVKNYLRHLSNTTRKDYVLLKKTKDFKLGSLFKSDYTTYMSILKLGNIHKSKWRECITQFQKTLASITTKFGDLDSFAVPQEWIDSQKKAKPTIITSSTGPKQRRLKLKGEIIGKLASDLERQVHDKNCKWVSTTWDLSKIHQERFLRVYSGTNEKDVTLMDGLFKASGKIVKFVQFSDRELKNMEKIDIHNWIKLEEFMKGENKPFKRIVTAYLIHKLKEQQSSVFNRIDRLESISKDFVNKINILNQYEDELYKYANDNIYAAMLEVAEANKAFDMEIYPIYLEIKALCEKLKFLNPLCGTLSNWDRESDKNIIEAIADLFKYYKTRIDWKNYNIKTNDDLLLEQPLTEETVEDLQD